jgi:hypothetical protein
MTVARFINTPPLGLLGRSAMFHNATHLNVRGRMVTIYMTSKISTATLYNWKAKYGGLEASQLKRIKELEEENNKLKRDVC